MKKIAVEEHFFEKTSMSIVGMWKQTHTFPDFMDPEATKPFLPYATMEFSKHRIPQMDELDIQMQIIGTGAPGIQGLEDAGTAVQASHEMNQYIYEKIQQFPERISGYASLPLQDPDASIKELEYCSKEYGFCGAMIQGSNQYEYMDDPKYDELWSALEELQMPLSLHVFHSNPKYAERFDGFPELLGPTWDWNAEATYHTLRMVFGGVFEKHPDAKLILGHLGESIPYILGRVDEGAFQSGALKYGKITKAPSEYIRNNLYVASSGMYSAATLRCAIDTLGADKVLFATDYPFFRAEISVQLIEKAGLTEEEKEAIYYKNAEKLFQF